MHHPLIELTKCRIREFFREPSAFVFVLLMPIVWMLLLGFSFSDKKKDVIKLGLEFSQTSENSFKNDSFEVVLGSSEELQRRFRLGQIDMYLTQGSKPTLFLKDQSLKSELAKDVLVSHLQNKDISFIYSPIEKYSYGEFLIPGLLALSLCTTSLYGVGMTLVVNRRENLLKRYKATPMNEMHFFLSYILGRFLTMCLEILSVTLGAWVLFDYQIKGGFWLLLGSCFLVAMAFTSLSFLLGSRMKNTGAYNGLANLIILPMMLLSGVWYSRSYLPDWIQKIADHLPLSLGVDLLREVMEFGYFTSQSLWMIAALLVYVFVFLFLAKKTFRWF
jgi:ABC-2 type transport system permease protein